MTWNQSGFGNIPFSGAEKGSWDTGKFNGAIFGGSDGLPRYLHALDGAVFLEGAGSTTYFTRVLTAPEATITADFGSATRVVASRQMGAGSFAVQAVVNDIAMSTKRLPLLFDMAGCNFVLDGGSTRIALEMNMLISAPLSVHDKNEIAAAVIAASMVSPIKADLLSQAIPTASEIAEAVTNNAKTLTISKFLGLK